MTTPAVLDLSGRRVLVCHSIVHEIIGSTVVTLDLATELAARGADVLVYAAFVDDPAAALFAERGLEVVDDAGLEGTVLADLDLVWVNSQALPVVLVDQLSTTPSTALPSFVFLHMSALPYAPDEHPYVHQLEERLSSLSLFVSPWTRDELLPYFETPPPHDLYPNPTPREFTVAVPEPPAEPRSVLVVSNHADPDLMAAKDVLRDRGLQVRHLGSSGEGQAFVTPEVLAEHDVVVSIGKTVQYCLVSGRPVFVYDHFGGFGYLDADTLPTARHHNFSGRGGRRMTPEEIADALLAGYPAAVAFQREQRDDLVATYAIDRVLDRVLAAVRPRDVAPFPSTYLLALRSTQTFGMRFFHYWGHNANEVRQRHAHVREIEELRDEVERRGRHVADLEREVEQVRGALTEELAAVRASYTFRIGRVAMLPVRVARRLRNLLRRA